MSAMIVWEIRPYHFGIYRGDQNQIFFKPSDKSIPFTPDADIPDADIIEYDELGVAPLCNGNYVTIRKFSHPKFPIRLTGRIMGKDYMLLGNDFLISDSELSDDRQHSVDTIYPKGFVVVWLASDRPTRKSTTIKARLFDQSGKPLGGSFNVSIYSGRLSNAIVRGLSDGGFVVVWYRFEQGGYFRVFDNNGTPKTKEVTVAVPLFPGACTPHLWISTTKEGVIEVFMNCYLDNKPYKTSPFDFVQRFDLNGRPLTSKLTGLEMQNLPSYKHAFEEYIKDTHIFRR